MYIIMIHDESDTSKIVKSVKNLIRIRIFYIQSHGLDCQQHNYVVVFVFSECIISSICNLFLDLRNNHTLTHFLKCFY